MINLRGRVIPVISLRARFGLAGTERNRASRIVVLNVEGQTIGAAVDAVSEVLRIPLTSVEPPGATLAGAAATRLRGIANLEDRLIILLEPRSILGDAEGIESVAA